jgi:microcystin-dependent protein
MNTAKFLQGFGLIALMACVSLVTQSLTVDSIEKESKEEQIASNDPFIGEMIMFGGNFAPRNWAFCNGQLLPINQHQALFSILGTIYGGDGRTTFALPDLRGRTPIHAGRGPGLRDYRLGSKGGQETIVLKTNQLPAHQHSATTQLSGGLGLQSVNGLSKSKGEAPGQFVIPMVNGRSPLNLRTSIGNAGANQSINNIQPYATVNYIICLNGTFPSRN